MATRMTAGTAPFPAHSLKRLAKVPSVSNSFGCTICTCRLRLSSRLCGKSREELPAEVLAKAPDATGGAEVTREYLTTERGDEILSGIVAGAINEMSYGYDAIKYSFENTPEGKQVRNLQEVRLWDISDVTFGHEPRHGGQQIHHAVRAAVPAATGVGRGNQSGPAQQRRRSRAYQPTTHAGLRIGGQQLRGPSGSRTATNGKSRADAQSAALTHLEAVDLSESVSRISAYTRPSKWRGNLRSMNHGWQTGREA